LPAAFVPVLFFAAAVFTAFAVFFFAISNTVSTLDSKSLHQR